MRYVETAWRYTTVEDATFQTRILGKGASTSFITLTEDGKLTVKARYSWDGASGPVLNTKDLVKASLVHDALYQLIRVGLLSTQQRKEADKTFLDYLEIEGTPSFRRWYIYLAVRLFGRYAVKGKTEADKLAK